MSAQLVLWCLLFPVLALLAFLRPIWGFSLYCLTNFGNVSFWWWGEPLREFRLTLVAGILFLIAVLVARRSAEADTGVRSVFRRTSVVCALILANATAVHFLLGANPEASLEQYGLLAKHTLLLLLIVAAVRTENDFDVLALTLVAGLAYLGWQVTIMGEGSYIHGRLENVGLPGASESDALSAVVGAIIPLAGGYLIVGRGWRRLLGGIGAATGVAILVGCNTRATLVGLIVGAFVLVAASREKPRKLALLGVGLGLTACLLLAEDRITSRFMTTFAAAEERDESAASRLLLWKAGLRMAAEYPLGRGGGGFKFTDTGAVYRAEIQDQAGFGSLALSVHNGYINEACEWGVQGFVLKMLLITMSVISLYRASRYQTRCGDVNAAFLGCCILAGISVVAVVSVTVSLLNYEIVYWMVAVAAAYSRVFSPSG